jgi:hypothetical protein
LLVSLIVQFVAEIFSETLVKGAGLVIIRLVSPKSEPGEIACAIAGLIFWVGVGALCWFVYRHAVGLGVS